MTFILSSLTVLFTVIIYVTGAHIPAYSNDTVRFMVLGDWGGLPFFPYRTPIETSVAQRLASTAQKYRAEFILALGDNFYFDGVANVEDSRFQETYNEVFKYQSCELNWYLVAGNHDHNGNVSAQVEYSNLVKRWNFPYFYYNLTFKIPNSSSYIDIIMIDTVILCGNSDSDVLHLQPEGPDSISEAEKQWRWIEDKLNKSRARYLIVAGHYPVYSIAEHGPTKLLVDRLMPMLHKYNATAYFSGHDHNMQHLQTSAYNHTVDYYVSGAANFVDPLVSHQKDVPPGSSKFHWGNIFSLGAFAYVEAGAKNMTFTFVESNGKVLYSNTMLPRNY